MDVDAAQPRRRQDRLGQDQAIGRDHRGIELERGEARRLVGVEPRRRLAPSSPCARPVPAPARVARGGRARPGAAAGNRRRRCRAPPRAGRRGWWPRKPACPGRRGAAWSWGRWPPQAGTGVVLALQLGELAQDDAALQRGDVIDEQHAFEMVHLVLDAGGEQALGLDLADLVLLVEIAEPDRGRAASRRHNARAGTGSPRCTPWSRPSAHRISGLAIFIGCGFSPSRAQSTTMTRSSTPTCGAARPMPWRLVHGLEHVGHQPAHAVVHRLDGPDFFFRRGSGAVRMGRMAMIILR